MIIDINFFFNHVFLYSYSCTNQGTIYQIDYQKIMLDKVIRLLPIGSRSNLVGKYGGTTPTEFGIRLNSLYVNESFCATGSDDGFLRLWPLDFSTVFLEAGKYHVLNTKFQFKSISNFN